MFAAALACLVAACSQPAPAPAPAPKPDLAAEEKAIREADARWLKAVQAKDAAGEAAMFATDGVAYRDHIDPLVGPAAVQGYETKFQADNPKENMSWSTDAVHVAESGDVAIQTGVYRVSGLGPQGNGEDEGRFVTVWKKVNGEWKVAHDIGATTMPEAPVRKP
jgi:uncharacterized protein (TIGR02246 family)